MIKKIPGLQKLLGTQGELLPQKVEMPIFITGTMRSGTTLLVNKLSEHPQLLKIGDELNHVWTKVGGASCVGICEHKSKVDASSYYTYQMTNYFDRYVNESKSFKRSMMRAYWYQKRNIGRIKYDWENIIPMNKSTHLMNKIGYVNGLFSGSKIILIIRDIYGQSSSQKYHFDTDYKARGMYNYVPDNPKSCWTRIKKTDQHHSDKAYPGNFKVIPQMWLRLNNLAVQEIQHVPEEQRLIVSYEELVKDQEKVLENVFRFLNLKPKHDKAVREICEQEMKFKNTTTTGNPLDKWKTLLSDEEIQQIKNEITNNQKAYDNIQNQLDLYRIK